MSDARWSGIRELTPQERRDALAEKLGLDEETREVLDAGPALPIDRANSQIENVYSVIGVPVGLGVNFLVDGQPRFVPMATEEPSVVAAASNIARHTLKHGGFTTSSTGPKMIAQIQVIGVSDPYAARARLEEAKSGLIEEANSVDPILVKFGGGCEDLKARIVETERGVQVVVHLIVDVRDAMGANAVNSMAEALKPSIEKIAGGRVLMRILSNFATERVYTARAVLSPEDLGGEEVVESILDAAALAEADAYRAATHNKGIMNGVSAVVLATGNDTRAVESGAHSYAARFGSYKSLSRFERDADGNLSVTLEMPMPVGLVGGATKSNPVAKANTKVLGVETADELSRVIVSVGLSQNIAAVRALADEGIQKGHMALHARTLASAAGAEGEEVTRVAAVLVETGSIRAEEAEKALRQLREEDS